MQGNRAFQGGYLNSDLARRVPIAAGQTPPVAVLSCSDSRVPPEVVFNRPIAQMFVVRTAGNVTEAFPTASLEYAVAVLSTKVIVVMGHESCGAIHSALTPKDDGKLTPFLQKLVVEIRKSFGNIPQDQWGRRQPHDRRPRHARPRPSRGPSAPHGQPIPPRAGKRRNIEDRVAYYDLETGVVELVP